MQNYPVGAIEPADLPPPLYLVVALGVVGGLFVGKIVYEQAFQQGLTTTERRNLLGFAAASAALWGVQQVIDLDKLTEQWTAQATSVVLGK